MGINLFGNLKLEFRRFVVKKKYKKPPIRRYDKRHLKEIAKIKLMYDKL